MSASVFRIRIRPDPKLFGLKDPDPDPKLLISDPDQLRIPILPFFTPNLKICFKNIPVTKSDKIHHNF